MTRRHAIDPQRLRATSLRPHLESHPASHTRKEGRGTDDEPMAPFRT